MIQTKYNVGDKLYTKSSLNPVGYNEYIITEKTEIAYRYAMKSGDQLADCGWSPHYNLDDNSYIYSSPEDIPQDVVKEKPKKNARYIN